MQLKGRNLGLDLVRSIAILLVLFAHSLSPDVLGINFGGLGVEIFFVLSGFLIGQIIIKEFSKAINIATTLNFWIRRWFRTLPLYYAVIIVKFVFFDHSLGYKILVYFFFLQNNFVGVTFFAISWSLVIEEWFYLMLPVLIMVFFRGSLKKNSNLFILFIVCFIVFEIIVRYAWVIYTDRPWGAIIGNFPFRMDSLMIGVLLASLKIFKGSLYQRLSNKYVILSGFFLLLFILLLFGHASQNGKVDEYLWTRTIWISILSFSIALHIPFLEQKFVIRGARFIFVGKIIEWISKISYSLYLLHQFTRIHYFHNPYLDIPLSYVLTGVVCTITYRYFENPVMNLRDKIKSPR